MPKTNAERVAKYRAGKSAVNFPRDKIDDLDAMCHKYNLRREVLLGYLVDSLKVFSDDQKDDDFRFPFIIKNAWGKVRISPRKVK